MLYVAYSSAVATVKVLGDTVRDQLNTTALRQHWGLGFRVWGFTLNPTPSPGQLEHSHAHPPATAELPCPGPEQQSWVGQRCLS